MSCENCENCEESAYVIKRMGKLLAEIAIIVNGTEPHDTLWSYHDLPEKVRALKQAQQPAAAVPAMDKLEADILQVIDQRDEREEVINDILDLVLGQDREEWSSAYGFRDAVNDVEERMVALSAAPPAAVPEGYALVPVEPTEAMLDVMHDRVRILCNPAEKSASIRNDREVWAAMLAAARKGE